MASCPLSFFLGIGVMGVGVIPLCPYVPLCAPVGLLGAIAVFALLVKCFVAHFVLSFVASFVWILCCHTRRWSYGSLRCVC
jgi:hypothetical protein